MTNGSKEIFEEIVAENFPELMKISTLQIQETQQTATQTYKKKSKPKHFVVKIHTGRQKGNL